MFNKISTAVLDLIRRPKATSAEYRTALAALDAKGAEAAVDDLEAQRQALLLKGDDGGIEAIEGQIKAGNREVERLHAAIKELGRLASEAEASEKAAQTSELSEGVRIAIANLNRSIGAKDPSEIAAQVEQLKSRIDAAEVFGLAAQVEARGAAQRGVQAHLMHLYLALDVAAAKLCEVLDAIDAGRLDLHLSNKFLKENARDDLIVQHPLAILGDHMGLQLAGRLFPVNLDEWKLPGYRHSLARGGRVFGRMQEVIDLQSGKAV